MPADPVVVCVGDAVVDVSVRLQEPLAPGSDAVSRTTVQPGGQAANVAVWLRSAGVTSRLLARVGSDVFGTYLRAELMAHGVEPWLIDDPERATGVCTVLVDGTGERTMLPDPGANAAAEPLPPGLLVGADLLYLSGYTLLREASRPTARTALAAARAAGLSVALDTASAAPLARVGAKALRGWASRPVLLLVNAAEAEALGYRGDEDAAVRAVAADYGEAVLTAGGAGAWWSDGEHVHHADAAPADVRDTTGAGDAFTAGLLAARLRGADPATALTAGAALAARAIGAVGAWPVDIAP